MKKYIVLPVIAVALLLSGFKAAETWAIFKSAEGHYSIMFPGKVEESVEDSKTGDGKVFKMHLAMCTPSEDALYMVGWVDMTGFYVNDKPMKQMLEDSRDGAAAQLNATDVTTTATNLNGDPYIEFTFATKEFVGKDRIYIIDKHQYSLITMFTPTKGMGPGADKFITSFKYTK